MDNEKNNFPELIEEFIDQIPQIQITSLYNDLLHTQDIKSSCSFVLEHFDLEHNRGSAEYLDEKRSQCVVMEAEAYRYLWERPLHRHDYLELMVVMSGSVRNYIEDTETVYSAGQGCIMNTNIRHKEVPLENAEVLFLGMQKDFLREILTAMASEDSHLGDPMLTAFLQSTAGILQTHMDSRQYWDFRPAGGNTDSGKGMVRMFWDVIEALRCHRPGCSYQVRVMVLRLLSEICDPSLYVLQNISSSLTQREFLVSRISFLIRASGGRIRNSELERYLCYHGDYLNRLFKQQTGKNISQYRSEVVMNTVMRLLRETEIPVDEIMNRLHITSRGRFFSKFQQQTGMTPMQYRNSR